MMTAHRISYWVKSNQYAANCSACGAEVEAREGWTQKDRDSGKWVTYCHPCAKANARALPDRNDHARSMSGNESHPVYRCCGCCTRVALVKGKSGRWYFANISDGLGMRPKVRTWAPHTCKTDEVSA